MTRSFAYHAAMRAECRGPANLRGSVLGAVTLIAAICVFASPVPADAKPPLRDVKEIDNELYYIAVANEISEVCPSISGRRLKAIGVMWDLRSKANKLGYSDKEIRAYVESDSEKDRMRSKGEAYLAQNGVSYDNPTTFCALGQKEIERNSAIGVYLRAN
ncbi:hypothetical protein RUESEDTHA_00384 [Ruegeria sp. THAF57]|nr:DUF5333 domain-containing protein [Ruegeria sp. THAF57]CAD0183514.1 hypothetical protein RUESEDTHA_00384 [Ruegeria sp. THAF57]